MTHPHTPSCLAVLSWATAAPLGASSSASPSIFPSGPSTSASSAALSGRWGVVSAGVEAAGESPDWAAERDEASFLSWRRYGKGDEQTKETQTEEIPAAAWERWTGEWCKKVCWFNGHVSYSHGGSCASFPSSSKTDNLNHPIKCLYVCEASTLGYLLFQGIGAFFTSTATKKPPVFWWCGRILILTLKNTQTDEHKSQLWVLWCHLTVKINKDFASALNIKKGALITCDNSSIWWPALSRFEAYKRGNDIVPHYERGAVHIYAHPCTLYACVCQENTSYVTLLMNLAPTERGNAAHVRVFCLSFSAFMRTKILTGGTFAMLR